MLTKNTTGIKPANSEGADDSGTHPYNFWEGANYVSVLKRHENSTKISTELAIMFDELSKIEARHGKEISDWASKWSKFTDNIEHDEEVKYSYYGSNKASITNLIKSTKEKEMECTEIWHNLQIGCVTPIKNFQNEILNKSSNSMKDIKAVKEDFRTAQKPYIEAVEAFKKARTSYISYSTGLRPEYNLGENTDIFNDLDSKKKSKWEKLKKRYEERKDQLSLILPHYIERMKLTSDKCDVVERQRLEMLKNVMVNLHNIYSLESNKKHAIFLNCIQQSANIIDVEKDLKDWALAFGPMAIYDHYQHDMMAKEKRSIFRRMTHQMHTKSLSSNSEKSTSAPVQSLSSDESEPEVARE